MQFTMSQYANKADMYKARAEYFEKKYKSNKILLEESHRVEEQLLDKIKELKNKKFTQFANEECWIYSEEDDNNLETLVCPVVIKASTLLSILKGDDHDFKD